MLEQIIEQLDIQVLLTDAVSYLPAVVAALLIFVGFWVFFSLVRRPASAVLERAGLAPALVHLVVDNALRYTVLVFALVMALDQLGVNVAAALAGIGVAGVAIGFAAQDTVANVISGFLIFLDKPFEVGHWVSVADQEGTVTEITLRSTRIKTPENTYVVIPNKTIIDEVLVNHSRQGHTRLNVPVGIAYKEYIPQAREVLLDAVKNLPKVLKEPAPEVVVDALGGSSVDLEVRVWIEDANDGNGVMAAVVEASKLALDGAGIEIPFPHLQLFVDDVKTPIWEGLAVLNRQSGPSN